MGKQILSLEDAVKIAVQSFGMDDEYARAELEQKAYITNNLYQIGFEDGVEASIKAVRKLRGIIE